ncbi:MAG: recombinase family protein [Dehalococcoidia bacterium]|nr:recombinase family protein [Dehalococcoidia bacterium]
MTLSGGSPRAVGYVRVSDESQVDGLSLDAQRREIERYCAQHGYQLVRYYSDEGVSAHTDRIDRRPQLNALVADAREGEFDFVLVHTIDRWARNVGAQREALQMLGDAGVGFASVTESIDFTTPSGRLMLTMLGGAAEFFSDQLGVHVSKAKRERAELGLSVGPIPFGYGQPEDPRCPPPLQSDEASFVRAAFDRRARGESHGSIARWLNDEGVRPGRHGGGLWTAHRVRDMLACDFYRGVVTYKGDEFPGQHEAIVDDDLFLRVKARKGSRSQRRETHGQRGLLQGRIRCGTCGQTLQSDRTYYGAPMYRERHSKPCPTNGRSIVATELDAQVEVILESLRLPTDWTERATAAFVGGRTGPSQEALKERLRRLGRVYLYGEMTDDEFEAQRADIEAQLRQADSVIRPSHHEAAAIFGDLPELWARTTMDEKRHIAGLLLDRVYVDLDEKLITAIVPTAEFGLLLQHALEAADRADILLVPVEHVDALDALHAFVTGDQVEEWTSTDDPGDGHSQEQAASRRNVGDGGDGGASISPITKRNPNLGAARVRSYSDIRHARCGSGVRDPRRWRVLRPGRSIATS